MTRCFFVSDLHGKIDRYQKLFDTILRDKPQAVFFGGDLLPHGFLSAQSKSNFVLDFLAVEFDRLQTRLASDYPRVFLILGNDDARIEETAVFEAEQRGIWEYIHNRKVGIGNFAVYGYACVPPTPFQLKDWERYDVSRFVDPGSISPEEGRRTVAVSAREMKYATIQKDLQRLIGTDPLEQARDGLRLVQRRQNDADFPYHAPAGRGRPAPPRAPFPYRHAGREMLLFLDSGTLRRQLPVGLHNLLI